MPSSLHKTRKQIAKKRNGIPTALHEKSRDSMRLHKATIRDQRLEKLHSARSKRELPILDRAVYFQESAREVEGGVLDMETVQRLIETFIHQYEEEYNTIKKERRPGRPASSKEDLLKIKIAALKEEHEKGFHIPDVMSAESARKLDEWEGNWTSLTDVPWIKVTTNCLARPTDFPSKALA
ncbi:translation machinery-associated protein 16 [Emericellopsis atlantica]|uniref:Translation machinery-associated protein 16 n=1 Tax=Emericellopsis atlantica TaxID=2614577 RepID=A0A9P8CLP5_9HYPO|nr:translation machinery-associated protein 16 [Emericellopsis atlantica]KAG9251220.1 translation machinery-associated protein 16 [Emericellopsis atlantica]